MDDKTLNKFRQSLIIHRDALLEWLHKDSIHENIHLGGAAVKDVLEVVSEIKDTLECIDNGKFGKCEKCDGEIETERLELDFTTQVCLDHYSEDQIRALEGDLELATKVQKQLLPCSIPSFEGIQIAARTESARIVSGDYYDFWGYRNGAQGVVIADVMGKGLPASILMSNLQASLRILGPEHEELHTLAFRLNEQFCHNLKLIRFITIFLAKIDVELGALQYCNAGHHPAIWWEAASGSINWLKPTGPAIGLTQNANYKTEELRFGSGDLFLFYTDGLVEARNSEGKEFGEELLANYVIDHNDHSSDVFLTKLLNLVKSYAGRFQDDVTMLVVKIQ